MTLRWHHSMKEADPFGLISYLGRDLGGIMDELNEALAG